MLPLFDLKFDPRTPEGVLLIDSPRRSKDTPPQFDPAFGEFAEIRLGDEIYKLIKTMFRPGETLRNYLDVDDGNLNTEFRFYNLTTSEKEQIKNIVNKVVSEYHRFAPTKSSIDIRPRKLNFGVLAGPTTGSAEEIKILYYILPSPEGKDDPVTKSFFDQFGSLDNFRKQFKIALPSRLALQDNSAKAPLIGPSFNDSSEFSDIPAYIMTIRLKYPVTTVVKDDIARSLTQFENKYKVPGMHRASTNFGWYDKLPAFLPSFFKAWLKDRIRVDQLVVNNPKAAKRLASFI